MKRLSYRARWIAAVCCLALVLAGLGVLAYRDRQSPAGVEKNGPRPPVQLKLLVVADEPLGRAIARLKPEWTAETGGKFETRVISLGDFDALPALDDDAVILPSGRLGSLVERDWVELISIPALEDPKLAWKDIFETLTLREATWAGQPYAIPFGSPIMVCWYRPDLFEKFRRSPPATWTEYQELAKFFSARENLGDLAPAADVAWSGALEPRAAGWGGRLLMVRAAAYALNRDAYSTFFNIDSMQPLCDSPPFVRALDELVAVARLGGKDSAKELPALDPARVRREFLAGHAALALTWPTAADPALTENQPTAESGPAASGAGKVAVAFAEPPGSDTLYNRAGQRWDRRGKDEHPNVALVGVAGRLGVVSAASSYPDESRALLAWLSTTWSARTSAASSAATMFRHSQLREPRQWVEAGVDIAAARQYAQVLAACLSRPAASLTTPRIPGEAEYLAALDDAVAAALSGEKQPTTALADAAARWDEITERRGRARQRAAYRRSLGLEQP